MLGLFVRSANSTQEEDDMFLSDMCSLEARVMLSATPMAAGEVPDEGELVNEDYSDATGSP